MDRQITSNKRKTTALFMLMGLASVILAVAVYVLVGPEYSILLFMILIAYGAWQYRRAMKQIIKLSAATEVSSSAHPELYSAVEVLSMKANIPMPKVYVIADQALNAFAAGYTPQKSIIGVTEGLLKHLNQNELEGVLAHEIGHIANRDTRIATAVFALTSSFTILAYLLFNFAGSRDSRETGAPAMVMALLAIIGMGVAVFVLKFAISQRREYLADASSAHITKHPQALKSALEKIELYGSRLHGNKSHASSVAHLFFAPTVKKMTSWFSTHPPLRDRIEALDSLSRGGV